MTPTKVLEVELGSALVDLPCPDHAAARVMVRLHGTPLGFLELAVEEGIVSAERVLRASAAELPVGRHLEQDRLTSLDAPAGPAGWPCQVPGPVPEPETVSVVLCTRDRAESLRVALTSVLAAARAGDEVLVVDNAPRTAATREVVEELDDPRVRYLLEPRAGLSTARNTGARAATGEVVAFTDDDVVVDAHWITALLRGFTRVPGVGCVTGLVPSAELETESQHFFDRKVQWSHSTTPRLYDLGGHRADSALYPYQVGMVGTGASFAVRRATYDQLGGFDEALGAGSLTRGGEDLDWFVRTLTGGWTIAYEPAAVVWHRHRRDLESLSDQLYGYGTGLTAYLVKHALTPAGFRHVSRTVLQGLRYSRRQQAASVGAGIDPSLLRRERVGMLHGPALYARARWRARQARR